MTGVEIARSAFKRLNIIAQHSDGNATDIAAGLEIGTHLLGAWRTQKLTVSGISRTVYNFVASDGSYTIGPGGDFNQAYPTAIERWSVIPEPASSPNPLELPMGRPLTWEEWQHIGIRDALGSFPNRMWYDSKFVAGLGRLHFYPIPETAEPDLVLYQLIPEVSALDDSATDLDDSMRPGFVRALILGIAEEIVNGGQYEVEADVANRVLRHAPMALADVKRANYRPSHTPIDGAFATLGRRRVGTFVRG